MFKKLVKITMVFFGLYCIYLLTIAPQGECYMKYLTGDKDNIIRVTPDTQYALSLCEFGWDYNYSVEIYETKTQQLKFQTSITTGLTPKDNGGILIDNESISVLTDEDDSNGYPITLKINLPPPWYERVRAYLISAF